MKPANDPPLDIGPARGKHDLVLVLVVACDPEANHRAVADYCALSVSEVKRARRSLGMIPSSETYKG